MQQFGNAMYLSDPQSPAVLAAIAELQQGTALSREAAIDAIARLARESPASGRSLLVYARLMFWGYLTPERAADELAGCLSANAFLSRRVFERQELAACFGVSLLKHLTSLSAQECVDQFDFSETSPLAAAPEQDTDETWCFVPPASGFFSVVETILLAQFLCKWHKKVLV